MLVAGSSQEGAQIFRSGTIFQKMDHQPFDRIWNISRRAAKADRPGDGRNVSETPANTEVIRVDHFSVGFDLFAFDTDVGDPVLAATVRASGNVQLDLL